MILSAKKVQNYLQILFHVQNVYFFEILLLDAILALKNIKTIPYSWCPPVPPGAGRPARGARGLGVC